MQEIVAEEFRREAAECRLKAEEAANSDKQAWLKLAGHGDDLTRGADLYQEYREWR